VDKEFSVDVSIIDLSGDKTIENLATKINNALANVNAVVTHGPFVQLKSALDPRRILVCFPYIGATAAAYNGYLLKFTCWTIIYPFYFLSWKNVVSSDTEVWVWEPTPFNTWADLVDHLASYSSAFLRKNGPPVIFYGHSFGGLVAFELACRLQNGMICLHKKVNKIYVCRQYKYQTRFWSKLISKIL
jgi:Thioesterase domain